MAAEEKHHPVEEQNMDFEETKEEEDERWLWHGNNHGGLHFIRPCDVGGATQRDVENTTEGNREGTEDEAIEDLEDEEDTEKLGGFPLFPNGSSSHFANGNKREIDRENDDIS
ncbi:PREDICTED: uncharacterized protein LOC104802250 isoform X2 [Tarenaya hassleriana]|uniref:uncharacterized protein LOC104802250 isoform X2 n=1 Tax=Tarenaya hassleriana TaxID=28532 RepID=UPI00053C7EFF|nr:PREDICTED: uncharacterized protein LOC104802250 isoform X2 [Tarenaya hassleriana]